MRAEDQTELGLSQMGSPSITAIEVRNLFGYLSYDIGSRKSPGSPEALILYGDNGSGKTSVLRLLFYLLSTAQRRGHKTEVARIVFSRFSVYFNTGIALNAIRPASETTGGFTMTLSSGSDVIQEFTFKVNPEGSIQVLEPDELHQLADFYEKLDQLGLTLFFLKDDRSIESTLFSSRRAEEEEVAFEDVVARRRISPAGITLRAVRTAVARASNFVRREAFRASNRGDTDTYNVYLEIIRRIAAASRAEGKRRSTSTAGLLKKLRIISNRAERLSSLGLISRVDVREMAALVEKMQRNRVSIAEQVVLPYVNSTTVRFDALERLATAVEKFLSYLNKFYRGKKITFDLHDGFVITGPLENRLTPDMLSSGEKHLLLLFCNILVAQETSSLFIIDEPELSLNVRWQRLLINALIDCVKETQVRFVFATHSVEMVAQHRKSVWKLEPLGSALIEKALPNEGGQSNS